MIGHDGKVAHRTVLSERRSVPDPKNITEQTTLAELRDQLKLCHVIALHIQPALEGDLAGEHWLKEARLHHATGIYAGRGATEAIAIEAAFVKLRRHLLPEPLKQYLDGEDGGST